MCHFIRFSFLSAISALTWSLKSLIFWLICIYLLAVVSRLGLFHCLIAGVDEMPPPTWNSTQRLANIYFKISDNIEVRVRYMYAVHFFKTRMFSAWKVFTFACWYTTPSSSWTATGVKFGSLLLACAHCAFLLFADSDFRSGRLSTQQSPYGHWTPCWLALLDGIGVGNNG